MTLASVPIILSLIYLTVTFVWVNASSLPDKTFENVTVQVLTSEELKELLRQNPNIVELNREAEQNTKVTKTSEAGTERWDFQYFFGRHTADDRRVAYDAQNHNWAGSKNIIYHLWYPAAQRTYGPIVNCVDIYVRQSSGSGKAYIINGGIGERYIEIVVEANNTQYLNYEIHYFGRN